MTEAPPAPAIVAVLALAGLAVSLAITRVRAVRRNHDRAAHPLPPLDARQRAAGTRIEADVRALAREPRSALEAGSLDRAAALIASRLETATTDDALNVVAEIEGRGGGIIVVGAHYDSVAGSPGADDNASGVATLLELHRRFRGETPQKTVRFIAFSNEEPPFFQTPEMGSCVYAAAAAARGEKIDAMINIESVGYYADRQEYPAGLSAIYPARGDFIAFVANIPSAGLLRRCARAFRSSSPVPVESAALPELVSGVAWSDQWSFWRIGVPAVMITDTAFFRNPHYHTAGDLPDTLDYARLSLVADGLEAAVRALANEGS